MTEQSYQEQSEKLVARAPIPVFWLFGKTGSGKTSIVRFLTGAERAEIGNGFAPQTRHSQQYDFPADAPPVLRFLDTRGLGESRYDPAEDIERFNEQAQMVIVVVRAMDHALEPIVEPLKAIRRAKPERPVLLALTTLHEAYPQRQHPTVDPFDAEGRLLKEPANAEDAPLPDELRRSLDKQRERFAGLVDRIVPIDFTQPEDGFEQTDFGGERLHAALMQLLPAAYRQTMIELQQAVGSERDELDRRAMTYVVGYSTLAATAAAVPIPWVDIPVVMGIQSHLIYRLGVIYGEPMNASLAAQTFSAIGGRLLTKMLLRESLKIIPYIGMAANAALAYAYTFGLGKAVCWYLRQTQKGRRPTDAEVERVWQEQIQAAAAHWRRQKKSAGSDSSGDSSGDASGSASSAETDA